MKKIFDYGRSEPDHNPECDCMACEIQKINQEQENSWDARAWRMVCDIVHDFLFIIFCAGLIWFFCYAFIGKAHAQDIVTIAQSQIGKGEMYGNNQGPEVEKYTKGQDVAWCAAFVSWCRFQAGKTDHYFLSARSYWRKIHNHVTYPRKGDIICFSRAHGTGHVGIVEKVQGNKITTIEANVGKYPAKIKEITYNIHHIPHLLGFVRMP